MRVRRLPARSSFPPAAPRGPGAVLVLVLAALLPTHPAAPSPAAVQERDGPDGWGGEAGR